MTRIVGIDPGLAKMGITHLHIRDDKIDTSHSVLCESEKGPQIKRLAYMCEEVFRAIDYDEIAVCEFPFGTQGHGKVNIEIFGNIRLYCFKKKVPFVQVPQSNLKEYATGKGNASKKEMQDQLKEEFGLELGEDATDSYWLAHIGYAIRYGTEKAHRTEIAQMLRKKHLELPF